MWQSPDAADFDPASKRADFTTFVLASYPMIKLEPSAVLELKAGRGTESIARTGTEIENRTEVETKCDQFRIYAYDPETKQHTTVRVLQDEPNPTKVPKAL
ncbi:hypothetical protein EVAR_50779_1 [Eumeta japonica]|uniref:Uncharacterized protein n=1 Tax=Eumeta variegata TaxID=151549 RepID=A0A4C1WS90_EUMVA|nr:hypothetical protein EVAR_50779_1 [Eumeta japonica]